MENKKKKLLQARWLLLSGIMLGSLDLSGCSVKSDAEVIYEAVKNDEDSIPAYVTGFYKNGDEYKLFYSYNGLQKYYHDFETGEEIGKYYGYKVLDKEEHPIFSSDQFIEFRSLDENLSFNYQEALEITDEMYENMFNNYSKNFKLDKDRFDVFEICNISTGEEFIIIGCRIEENTIFNLESFKIEDYSKCIVNKVESMSIFPDNTRDAFLKKFYEKYYPDRLSSLDIKKTR